MLSTAVIDLFVLDDILSHQDKNLADARQYLLIL